MAKPSLDDIKQLLHEIILPFNEIQRDMPLPIASKRNENDAEHSWALALLASCMAPEVDKKLDIGKVCQFAIVHDLVEIYAGDTSFWGEVEHKASKSRREIEAMEKIEKTFGHFPWLISTVRDYESKSSNEAKFIYALDKFINLLIRSTDNGQYFKNKRITFSHFETRIQEHKRKAHSHRAVADYYDELLELFLTKPSMFYQERS